MASTSRVDAVLTAIQGALTARPGLAGVKVFSAGVSLDDSGLESIQLNSSLNGSDTVDASHEWAALANAVYPKNETITIPASILIIKAGKGEPVIQAARARAFALLAEVEDAWRDDITLGNIAQLGGWTVTAITLGQGFTDKGRVCVVDFTLEVRIRLVGS